LRRISQSDTAKRIPPTPHRKSLSDTLEGVAPFATSKMLPQVTSRGVSRSPIPVETGVGSPWVSPSKKERGGGCPSDSSNRCRRKGREEGLPLFVLSPSKREEGGVPLLVLSPSKRERGGGVAPPHIVAVEKGERRGCTPPQTIAVEKGERRGSPNKEEERQQAYLLRLLSLPSTCGHHRFESK